MSAKVWQLGDTEAATKSKVTLSHPNWVFSVSVEGDLAATGCGDRVVIDLTPVDKVDLPACTDCTLPTEAISPHEQ